MKRFALLIAALFLAATSVTAAEIRGAWTASASADEDAGRMYLQITRNRSNNGQTMLRSSFTGLTDSQIHSVTQVPVSFKLVREAGTLTFDGTFRQGSGAGQFVFAPDAGFVNTLRSLDLSTEGSGKQKNRDLDEQLLQMAIHDVSSSFIRGMQAEGYRGSLDDYFSMRIHRVTPELVRELRLLGYDKISSDDLVSSQIHRVTPQYIREMRAAGQPRLSLEELTGMRIHRATPEFIAELRELGYTNLDSDSS